MAKREVAFVNPTAGCRSAENALSKCLGLLMMLRQGIKDNREIDEKNKGIHAISALRLLDEKAEEAYRSIVGPDVKDNG